jgi:bifunctional DNA-binding transcriptional regulator/antitoxin component of YhaV-PrlF toxin-antitoxin module
MVTGTMTSKSMVTIPADMKRKYGFTEGGKVTFIEQDVGILIVPKKNLIDYYGIDEAHAEELKQAIRELDGEHRREAREE